MQVETNDDGMDSKALAAIAGIFRSYDIRGLVPSELSPQVTRLIARALGTRILVGGSREVLVATDGRLSVPLLKEALLKGLLETGIDVLDLGPVPTPLLYFATRYTNCNSGVVLTGSHNPPEYNGMKIMIDGESLAEDALQELRAETQRRNFTSGQGRLRKLDVLPPYIAQICADISLARSLKVAVDCGNGVAGPAALALLQGLGCEVLPLYCDVDGHFPNHHPDPAVETNMQDLIKAIRDDREITVGLAFDGDGDRLGVVSNRGRIIWPDRLLLLFARSLLRARPGSGVVYDVKSSRRLAPTIRELGGRPQMIRTGHSHLKAMMRTDGVLLGGEFSGHICFRDRWHGFDDALYAAARLLEILSREEGELGALFDDLPQDICTPEIKVGISDSRKFDFVEKLRTQADFGSGRIDSTDGLRVEYEDGWGLVRASNTTPALTLRFEAESASSLARIRALFAAALYSLDPDLPDISKIE